MTDEANTGKKEEPSKIDPASTGKIQPADPPTPPIIGTGPKEQIAGKSRTEKPKDECDKSKEILVRVLEGDVLSQFEQKTLFWGRWGIGLAFATFIVGTLTLIVFYRQLALMQTQLQDAESDGRTASRHARQQIRALQSQVSAIQTQMRQGQRAWLSFEDVGVTKDINGRMVFSFSLRNSGKSPALNAHANYSVKNVISGDQLTFTYTGKNNERETARASIAPTATRYVKVYEGPISPEEINRIITRQKTVYFYGKATYDDIFSRHHWVTFCTYLELSGTDLVLNYCSEHNETDQEIENQ